ncbi:MAG: hypothetical protein LBC60_02130 [Spirochaetaceae bacterium]|jgi:hypothetical protein|nr:hypothetical protein [Spirochaetaceae bacterium]
MDFDYDKEEQAFLAELNAGMFGIERIPNKADDYSAKEDRDVNAYSDYLKSDSFKFLNDKVVKNG